MTISACYLLPEGVVLATDSTMEALAKLRLEETSANGEQDEELD